MVGLFWIEEPRVCLGAPPAEGIAGVFLSPTELSITGPALRILPWADITDIQVEHIPIRSAPARWAIRAATVAAAALDVWSPTDPPELTVVIHTGAQRTEATAPSAAATAYTQREVDLSLALLSHFVRGTASPATLTDWWTRTRPTETLHSRDRETILEEWLGPLL
ncbi:hypothetical protein F3K43_21715 [Streptomyces sp. LBUM 1476]|nr:hypothetical protein [Streptomyces sp. LBUM 1476]MBZ3909334.1 hypothetical protein [Streptomyces acidiscabies]GAQ55217.1 hypothetical protein a10_05039 [Streptomyces acidiscabies]GAV42538.1 hypothetical protein Saa2_05469 [Streptomyces acidiscabies]